MTEKLKFITNFRKKDIELYEHLVEHNKELIIKKQAEKAQDGTDIINHYSLYTKGKDLKKYIKTIKLLKNIKIEKRIKEQLIEKNKKELIISQVENQEEEDEENIKNNKTDRYYEALKNGEIEKVWVDIWGDPI